MICGALRSPTLTATRTRSISDCITHLWPRMAPGGVMWFDDYGFLDGAKAAILEHFSEDRLNMAPDSLRCFVVKQMEV